MITWKIWVLLFHTKVFLGIQIRAPLYGRIVYWTSINFWIDTPIVGNIMDRILHKISDFLHFTSAILIYVNGIDEHVKWIHACMNAVGFRCGWGLNCICAWWIILCAYFSSNLFKHSVLAIFVNFHVHGLLAWVFKACSRVLFAGRRHGDVTVHGV